MIKIKFKKNHSQIYYLEYWLGSHLPGMSTFITGKLCNGLLSYILLILLLSTRKCFRLFVRVTSLFIDNIKTIQNNYKCIACSDIQMIIFNINSLKYVLYNIFRLFFNFCAIVIPQAETRVNIRFWKPSCKQETKTTAPADVYKAWNPKGWQTLRKAQAYFLWYYASVL